MRKDTILLTFFKDVLNINEEIAEKDAENLKNSVSCYTITQLEKYLREVLNKDMELYDDYCICNHHKDTCDDCIQKED
jgi:Mn-dependent DtxR family transcriptional regulator